MKVIYRKEDRVGMKRSEKEKEGKMSKNKGRYKKESKAETLKMRMKIDKETKGRRVIEIKKERLTTEI